MNWSSLTLVLGATGKTGSRVAAKLEARNVPVRRAARSGTEFVFDWDDATTHGAALEGVERIYLVGPLLRTDFAAQVGDFLDRAQAAGTRHVTYLSMHDIEAAPAETAQRRVELDLASRADLTHTILRPAWFMQNFSESFLAPVNGTIVVPTGNGAEAFVDVEDIAAVATETLLEPAAHHSAQYAITGPEALTVAQAAAILGEATGETIRHQNIDRAAWASGLTANGVPADYADVVCALTETIAAGRGAQPTDVVARVTGSAPRSFADFARHLAISRASTEAA
jgi:uncharacterized protein YbjT (DUF2867 family)